MTWDIHSCEQSYSDIVRHGHFGPFGMEKVPDPYRTKRIKIKKIGMDVYLVIEVSQVK